MYGGILLQIGWILFNQSMPLQMQVIFKLLIGQSKYKNNHYWIKYEIQLFLYSAWTFIFSKIVLIDIVSISYRYCIDIVSIQYPMHIARPWRGGRTKGREGGREEGRKERME